MEVLQALGCPLLLGASRKSVIGLTLDLPVAEREEGTLVTTVLAVLKGYQHIRVHNVKGNKRAAAMTQAILNA
jgi:dihydropteroate synthase